MKEATIVIQDSPATPGLEYDVSQYPQSGVYFSKNVGMYVFVAKEAMIVNSVSAHVFEQAMRPASIDAPEKQEGIITASDLIKMLAVTVHRDAAVAALAV
jgi:hypothetical protein